jgi:hypothetical protein
MKRFDTCIAVVTQARRETEVLFFVLVCLCFFFAGGSAFADQVMLAINGNPIGAGANYSFTVGSDSPSLSVFYFGNNESSLCSTYLIPSPGGLMPNSPTINYSLAGYISYANDDGDYYDLEAQTDMDYLHTGSHFTFSDAYANILKPAPGTTTLELNWLTQATFSGDDFYNFSWTMSPGMVSASAANSGVTVSHAHPVGIGQTALLNSFETPFVGSVPPLFLSPWQYNNSHWTITDAHGYDGRANLTYSYLTNTLGLVPGPTNNPKEYDAIFHYSVVYDGSTVINDNTITVPLYITPEPATIALLAFGISLLRIKKP